MDKNRFEHLKKKKDAIPIEEFINAANQEEKGLLEPKKSSTKEIILSVAGKIDREKDGGKNTLIYLKKEIKKDIQKYCYGNKTIIINYLLRKGLDYLISNKETIVHMEEN